MDGGIVQVARARVHIVRSIEDLLSVRFVNVTKDVQLGPDSPHRQCQLFTANPQSAHRRIQDSVWWSMRQHDVHPGGNLGPDLSQRLTSIQVKRPVEKAWLPRTPIDADSVLFARLILQVRTVLNQAARGWILFKQKVVIARDDDLVAMRQSGQPGIEVDDLGAAAAASKIPRTDEQISVGNRELSVQPVGVTDTNYTHAKIIAPSLPTCRFVSGL